MTDIQESTCKNCNVAWEISSIDWSSRIELKSINLVDELTEKYKGYESTSTAFCDLCANETTRVIKTKHFLANTYFTLTLNKLEVQKLSQKVLVPFRLALNDEKK